MSRQRLLTIILGVVLVAALPNIVPMPSRVTLNAEADAARVEAATLNEQISAAGVAQAAPSSFAAKSDALVAAIPDGPDLPGVISALRDVAMRSGLKWEAGAPQRVPATDETAPASWTMTVSLKGSGTAVPIMIDALRNISRVVVIDSVSYQGTNGNIVNATIMLRFFALTAKDEFKAMPKAPAGDVATEANASDSTVTGVNVDGTSTSAPVAQAGMTTPVVAPVGQK